MNRYNNGVQKPKGQALRIADEIQKLLGMEPKGYYGSDYNSTGKCLGFNPKRSAENIRKVLVAKYGQPTKDTYSSGWNAWSEWTDWQVYTGKTQPGILPKFPYTPKVRVRLAKTGPRSCRIFIVDT